jgi:hypothetical protein
MAWQGLTKEEAEAEQGGAPWMELIGSGSGTWHMASVGSSADKSCSDERESFAF